MSGYHQSIRFTVELPVDYMGDDSWVRDDGGPMPNDYRSFAGGPVLVVQGFFREGMHEVPLMRLDKDGEIIETVLLNFRHEQHTPKGENADGKVEEATL
jgi:hypothetical protein